MGQGFGNQRPGVNISAAGSLVNAGTVVLSNVNGVSFGLQTGAVSSVLTATVAGVQRLSAGTQSASAGTIVFSNSNNVSFGMSLSSQITVSVTGGLSGIIAGTQTATSGSIVFSNSNGISWGLSNSSVITALCVNSPIAFSAGAQLGTTGTLVLSNSNGFTFGMSGSSRVTMSVLQGVQAIVAGTQTATSGTINFANSNNVSWSLNAGTLTPSVSSIGNTVKYWDNSLTGNNFLFPPTIGTGYSGNAPFGALTVQVLTIPYFMNAIELGFNAEVFGASSSYAYSANIYTINGTLASLASSASFSQTWNSTNAFSTANVSSAAGGIIGQRFRPLPVTWNITPGHYLLALVVVGSVFQELAGGNQSLTNAGQWVTPTYPGATAIYSYGFVNALIRASTFTALPSAIGVSDLTPTIGGQYAASASPFIYIVGS